MSSNSPIIVALDYSSAQEAIEFVSRITPKSCRLKIGNELFTAAGTEFVWELVKEGFDIFLDLKYHDIPNTVANACRAASELGVWMISVHCLGGRKMLEAASNALRSSLHKPLLMGVTLLTSSDETTLLEMGLQPGIQGQVNRLAKIAKESGLDGVVCSPNECVSLRQELGLKFKLVTPGIRMGQASIEADDQQRVTTPSIAIESGANYLVIGRPITQAEDPLKTLDVISKSIGYIA